MLITDITLQYSYYIFNSRMSTSLIDEIDEISKQADMSDLGNSQSNMPSNTGAVHLEPIVPKKKKRRKKKQNQENIEMNSMNMTNSMASGMTTTLDGVENPSFESNTLERNQPLMNNMDQPDVIPTNPNIGDENNNTTLMDGSQITKLEETSPLDNPQPLLNGEYSPNRKG